MNTIPNLKKDFKETEDKLITIAMSKAKGIKAHAAKLLGMDERTLHRRISERKDRNES